MTEPRFKISLAQYSLHRKIAGWGPLWRRALKRVYYGVHERPGDAFNPLLPPVEFPEFARATFDIGAVEYVSGFYKDRRDDAGFWKELKQRADGAGVENVLIMVDGEGAIGAPDKAERETAIANHFRWAAIAAGLGCYAIRVIAETDLSRSPEEQQDLVADGISRLAERCRALGVEIVIENKGGLSCNGAWLAALLKKIDNPHVGALPDFGNFELPDGTHYDAVKGVQELMPYAKGVSVKAFDFDADGNECTLPFNAMMQAVIASDFSGYLGLEYEGVAYSEVAGIRALKSLVEKTIAASPAIV